MKLRVVSHEGYFHLEKSSWFGWEYVRGYPSKDEALLGLATFLNYERTEREKKRKVIIAQEKV